MPWHKLFCIWQFVEQTRTTPRKPRIREPGECVGIEEALQAYTEFGAFSQKQEHVKGRLVPGQLADVAVFSRDLLTASPEDILKDTRCDLTILGGKVVFERGA